MSSAVITAAWTGLVGDALGWDRQQDFNGDGWRWSWTATLDQLRSAFGVQLALACLVVVAALALSVAVRGRAPWRGLEPSAAVLAAGSVVVIAACTLTPRQGARRADTQLQLVPLHTVREYWILHSPSQLAVFIGGNVMLFVPLGFFAYLAVRRRFGRVLGFCVAVSLTIEILQLPIASRSTDVDDVLTNALGGLLGVVAGYAVVRLRNRGAASAWGRAASPSPP